MIGLVIAAIAIIVGSLFLLMRKGWEYLIVTLAFIIVCLISYIITLKLWGDEGKKYLAIALWIVAFIVLYFQKKNKRKDKRGREDHA